MSAKFLQIILFFLILGSRSLAQTFESSNLPIVVINTNGQQIVDEPKIIADMGIIYKGEGQRNNVNDPKNHYQGKIGIEFRGSSSQSYPKKSYGFETRDPQQPTIDVNVSLLGMPQESDWILYAPYSDKTMLRDVMAYWISNKMGKYASRTKFCELVINGQYMGVYVLMEKIKRDVNRVNISKLESDENSGDALTGGYIFKVDKFTGSGGGGFSSQIRPDVFFQYEYPDDVAITSAQKTYLKNFVREFEFALATKDFSDLDNGYRKYIDVSSFIDFFILNELMGSIDAYRLSTYLYKQRNSKGGKIHSGPIWDFNISSGNVDYCNGEVYNRWLYEDNSACPGIINVIPFWFEKLVQDPVYSNELKCRWKFLRENTLHKDTIFQWIDKQVVTLNESQTRNYVRWPILGQYVWPNRYLWNTYNEEITYFKSWLQLRLTWLDENMPGKCKGLVTDNPARIIVYPNPTTQTVNMFFKDFENKNVTTQIFDLMGKKVAEVVQFYDGQPLSLDLNKVYCRNGLYFLKIFVDNKLISTQKILKR
jgi:hypothetical protein